MPVADDDRLAMCVCWTWARTWIATCATWPSSPLWVSSIRGPCWGLKSAGGTALDWRGETKGNELTREALQVLKQLPIRFIGNVEGRDLYNGHADVNRVRRLRGNVALKTSEGLAAHGARDAARVA